MTTTDVAGLPAELRAVLARARVSQEQACDDADLPRSTYYRRDRAPAMWVLGDLVRLLAVIGIRLGVRFDGVAGPGSWLDLDVDADGVHVWRLGALDDLARGLGLELRIELPPSGLVARAGQTDTPPDETVAGLGGLSG